MPASGAALLECGSRTQAQRKIANQPTKHYRRSTARPGWPVFRCGHVTPRRLRPGKRPGQRGAPKFQGSKSQAATLVGATSQRMDERANGTNRAVEGNPGGTMNNPPPTAPNATTGSSGSTKKMDEQSGGNTAWDQMRARQRTSAKSEIEALREELRGELERLGLPSDRIHYWTRVGDEPWRPQTPADLSQTYRDSGRWIAVVNYETEPLSKGRLAGELLWAFNLLLDQPQVGGALQKHNSRSRMTRRGHALICELITS
jgi:hypothetical protein